MSKIRWASVGLVFLGAYIAQAFGCGSSSSTPAPATTGGNACCACTVTEESTGLPTCTVASTVAAPDTTKCSAFCATVALKCSTGQTVTRTVSGDPAACPSGVVPITDGGSGTDGSVVLPSGDGSVASPTALGGSCKADTDCGAGFICLKPTDNLGPGAGPPNGLCTLKCDSQGTNCSAVGGRCVNFDDPNALTPAAYCLQTCTTGPVTGAKCHNRNDVACEPLSMADTVCIPICNDDADCGTRKCDLGTGLCVDVPTAGAGIGSSCMVDSDCAGALCLPLQDSDGGPTPGFCSAYCRYGAAPEGCGFRRSAITPGSPVVGGCLLGLDTTSDEGDVGYCFQLCDAPGDCLLKSPDWTCRVIPSIQAAFNHNVCYAPAPTDGGTIDAAEAGPHPSVDAGAAKESGAD